MCKCFLAFVLYCCDKPEGRDISTVLRGSSVPRSCVDCLSTVEDIRHLRCQEACDPAETEATKEYSRERENERKAAVWIAQEIRDVHRLIWSMRSRCLNACRYLIDNPF